MKLIRDKYVDIIDGGQLDTVESKKERMVYMIEKLSEELLELKESHYRDVNEYADVVEVLYALAGLNDIGEEELNVAKKKKFDEKGGFNNGVLLLD